MANDGERNDEIETTYSGKFGERNRNTPGRTPGELGLDPAEKKGQGAVGEASAESGAIDLKGDNVDAKRESPALTPDVETMGEGGISQSGGRAGGARGHSGTSDRGAGGPTGESRGGPGEYKSTSRTDLDHGSTD